MLLLPRWPRCITSICLPGETNQRNCSQLSLTQVCNLDWMRSTSKRMLRIWSHMRSTGTDDMANYNLLIFGQLEWYFVALVYLGAQILITQRQIIKKKRTATLLQALMVHKSMYLWNRELEAELVDHGAGGMDSACWSCLTERFDPCSEAGDEKIFLLSWWILKLCRLWYICDSINECTIGLK